MDGVTDAAFRRVTAATSHPDVLFTEFVTVEGVARGALQPLEALRYTKDERPVVAQLYGNEPESFYVLAQIVAALGFDGLDINMGCPAKKVVHRGAGAGLIKNPTLAGEIVMAARKGLDDWAAGMNLEDIKVKPAVIAQIKQYRIEAGVTDDQPQPRLPLSIKTRLGYEQPAVIEWFSWVATQPVAAVTIHGRTLKQLYTGQADWSAIGEATKQLKSSRPDLVVIGNGDVQDRAQAEQRAKEVGVDGVLIGRAALGNPWVLTDHQPTAMERVEMAIKHAQLFAKLNPPRAFTAYRRHLAAYIKAMPNAAALRGQLMQVQAANDVERILTNTK